VAAERVGGWGVRRRGLESQHNKLAVAVLGLDAENDDVVTLQIAY
jgi:hypothetical protein